jgi:transglutaminase-like putative cysteine protease
MKIQLTMLLIVLSLLSSKGAMSQEPAAIPAPEITRRLKLDYPLSEDQLYGKLQGWVAGLTQAEFKNWLAQNYFESQTFNGKKYYFGRAESNLFFRHPQLNGRRLQANDAPSVEQAILENVREIKLEGGPYVLPTDLEVNYKVSLKANNSLANKQIKAWLPLPMPLPYQSNFELLSSSWPLSLPEDEAKVFSGFMQEQAAQDGSQEFNMHYRYQSLAQYFNLKPDQLAPYKTQDAEYKRFTVAEAHITFSRELDNLSGQILAGESNPILQAKKFYNWISENVQYSFAPEYSTIADIGRSTLQNRYGDCGQQAILFISLCRLNGIPARFVSGWLLFPGRKTIHDWAEVYFEPYGWVPVDPFMGGQAMQYMQSLTPSQKEEVRDFYFGGLDQYRLTVNLGHKQELVPKKCSIRSDDVDFQRAELETEDCQNIYFDQFKYSLEVIELN